MRKSGYQFDDLKFTIDIFELFPPPRRNTGTNQRTLFEDVRIPLSLRNSHIHFSLVSDPIRPDRSTTNAISQEMANAANSNPVSIPYVHVDYFKRPWIQSIIEHENASNSFKIKMKQYKSLHPLSIQQYVLYRLRFIMATALCKAFDNFGGIVGQINNISIIMQIAVTDNPNIAMLYGDELHTRLSRYARERSP